MINLINETLIHPHINTKWTVVNCEKGMLECVSEDSVKVEYITKEFGLEMYAEQQKQRADELEKRWSELRERLNTSFENSEYFLEGFGFSDVLKLMQQLEEDNNDI